MIGCVLPLAAALAAVPARAPSPRLDTHGFRVELGAGSSAVTSRFAFVADPIGPEIAELSVQGQLAWRHFSLRLELPALAAGVSETWSDAGAGNAAVELAWVFGGRSTHTLGVRGAVPVGRRPLDPRGDVAFWGTEPATMLQEAAFALVYGGAVERWVWRTEVGFRTFDSAIGWYFPIVAAAGLATVQPVAPEWALVAEAELRWEYSPLQLRGLVRRSLPEGWSVDAGLAVPVLAFGGDPTLQLLLRGERRW
jgi:hypothetical protein